jgi:hypothetical protein
MQFKFFSIPMAAVASTFLGLAVAVPARAGSPDLNRPVAFAGVSKTGALLSVGGSLTTSATSTQVGTGEYQITFKGTYNGNTKPDDPVPVSNADGSEDAFAVSNALVVSVNKTTMVIQVNTLDIDTGDAVNNGSFVIVTLGNPPK